MLKCYWKSDITKKVRSFTFCFRALARSSVKLAVLSFGSVGIVDELLTIPQIGTSSKTETAFPTSSLSYIKGRHHENSLS